MIKTLLSYVARDLKWGKYFTFWITSSVEWRVKGKLFLPYQIWYLKATKEFEFAEERTTNFDE
jgi:hypothetical protein